jgi:NADPH2:quinone reductase
MKAICLESFGGIEKLHLRDWPMPEPGAGEVRVRILAAAVHPVDYEIRRGRSGGELPIVLGHDFAGTVEAVGQGVAGLREGDAVYGYLGGPRSNGTFAEYACAPVAFVRRKPAGLSFAQAAAVPLAGLTAYECVTEKARIQEGDSVLVAGGIGDIGGGGGIGGMAVQLARDLAGADPVLATAGSAESAAYLGELGVRPEHIVRYPERTVEELAKSVLKANGGKPVRAAFDFVGGDMKRLCCAVIGFEGNVVSTVEEPPEFDLPLFDARRSPLFARSASFHCESLAARARSPRPADWQVYADRLDALTLLFEDGVLEPPRVTAAGPLTAKAVGRAFELLAGAAARGKLVITVAEG